MRIWGSLPMLSGVGSRLFFPKRRWLTEFGRGASACGKQLFHRLRDFRKRRGFFEVTVD